MSMERILDLFQNQVIGQEAIHCFTEAPGCKKHFSGAYRFLKTADIICGVRTINEEQMKDFVCGVLIGIPLMVDGRKSEKEVGDLINPVFDIIIDYIKNEHQDFLIEDGISENSIISIKNGCIELRESMGKKEIKRYIRNNNKSLMTWGDVDNIKAEYINWLHSLYTPKETQNSISSNNQQKEYEAERKEQPRQQEEIAENRLISCFSTQDVREKLTVFLDRSIQIGLMDDRYDWKRGQDALAYFVAELSNRLGLSTTCRGKKRISWKPFERLIKSEKFAVSGLPKVYNKLPDPNMFSFTDKDLVDRVLNLSVKIK